MEKNKKSIKTRGMGYDRQYYVNEVALQRIKGKPMHDILHYLMSDLGMSEKIAYEIVKDAKDKIVKQQEFKIETALAEAIGSLEEQLKDAGSDKKLKLEIKKELNKLQGLYSAQKVDVNVSGQIGININISSPEDKKKLDDLL